MRPLPLLAVLALVPGGLRADPLDETHFRMNFCWGRTYSAAHLAEHPDQRVSAIELRKPPIGWPHAPGETVMAVRVTFRGADGSRVGDEAEGIGACRPDGERLRCTLEGDAGDYGIEASEDGVLLSVGERGMLFETPRDVVELRPDEGDDRAFALRRCG